MAQAICCGLAPARPVRATGILGSRNFSLNIFCHFSINIRVIRLKPIVAMLMLALFAFASSHALLETFGLIHQEDAHAEEPASPPSTHELADGKCRINAVRDEIQTPDAGGAFDFAKILALASAYLHQADLDTRPTIEIASSPPPELGASRHFISRAALPARAPSFVS